MARAWGSIQKLIIAFRQARLVPKHYDEELKALIEVREAFQRELQTNRNKNVPTKDVDAILNKKSADGKTPYYGIGARAHYKDKIMTVSSSSITL